MHSKNNKESKQERPVLADPRVEVTLIADHEHGGKKFKEGAKITVRKSQIRRLKEWGRIK